MFQNFGILLFFVGIYFGTPTHGATNNVLDPSCNEDQLKRCTDNADPLLSNADYIVPDNTIKINQVCRLWTEFTRCIHNYTQRCWERGQRMEFDRTFKEPVSSMNNLCQNPKHREEYLKYAPCVKKISTKAEYCGNQYKFLIDLVSEKASMKQICCARAKFRNCILNQTPRACDGGTSYRNSNDVDSTTMAVSILDTSLTFINQRCTSSSFNEADCPGIDANEIRKNSKGPLREESRETSGSNFQLDQGSKPSQSGLNPSTTKRILQERPKTDKLSSSTLGGHQKPGHQSAEKRDTGKDSANIPKLSYAGCLSVAICMLFSHFF